jgi:tetratricopeptide (TPR) repeat protein
MLKNYRPLPLSLFLLIFLFALSLNNCLPAAETELAGFTEDRIDEIKEAIEPVLKGQPVTDIPEKDRQLLFLAEMLYSDSFELFLAHGEYLADVKRDYTQAIPRLKRAYELKPKEIKILEKLAKCHKALKQDASEVACWETLRELLENEESDQDPEKHDLRKRVMVNLDRMARENAMIMRPGRRFIVYTPVDSAYAYVTHELIDDRLEEIYMQVTGDLACVPAFRTSILVLDPIKFEEVSPTSWAGGFATGGKSMTLPADSFPRSEPETRLPARKLVTHEFTHNIIFIMGGGKCPTWLNEGLAVFSEKKDDGFTEFKPYVPAPNEVMDIEELEKEFVEIRKLGKESLERVNKAYQLAGLYARFLIQNGTMAAPRQIINSLKSGMDMEKALYTVTGLSIRQFENDFKAWTVELASN